MPGVTVRRRAPAALRCHLVVTIEHIEIRLLRLPLVHAFETSFSRKADRTFIVVAVRGGGLEAYGECVADDDPYYSYETTETAWHILSTFLAPRVLGVDFGHPREIFPALQAVRGHRMAKAALEMAAWDLHARQEGRPLSAVLGGTRQEIASGVSIGIQGSLEALAERVAIEIAAGYRRIKIKIKPGWDIAAVETVRKQFGAMPLMVDANAAYHPEDAAHLQALDAFDLLMIEQPLAYDDLREHARLQRRLRTPICLDESIATVEAADEALSLGACRIINVKPGRMGGYVESIRLHDLCAARRVPVWHGGMLESGIGRVHNVHLASLPNFTLPGDIAASRRYYAEDLIDPPVEVGPDGTIPVPTGLGIGVALRKERIERATLRRLALSA
jgi:o-succinylbenzoate synthase